MKNHNYVLRLVAVALFAAIIMLATWIHIPVGGGGYINPGDSMIYAAAWLLGGPFAAVAAAIGSAFADIIIGYVIYAPATFIIKGLMGLAVGILIRYLPKKFAPRLLALIVGALIMMIGYFGFEFFAISKATAFAGILWNLIQGVGGVVIGIAVIESLRKINGINSMKEKLGSRN